MLNRLGSLFGRKSPVPESGRRVVPLADYDSALKVELKDLPQRTQAAFAAACAERLYPAYAAFVQASGRDDQGLIRRTLDLAWDGAKTGVVAAEDPATLFEQCVALIPGDQSEEAVPPHADDAIASVAYALQAAAGLDAKAAGWAAEQLTNCLDTFLLSNEIDISTPDAEQQVWDHPLVVAEVRRRKDDLRRLSDPPDWGMAVDAVRAASTGVSALPLDRLDHEA
jgi:uncharacterized protein YjaG (DUF416 family)